MPTQKPHARECKVEAVTLVTEHGLRHKQIVALGQRAATRCTVIAPTPGTARCLPPDYERCIAQIVLIGDGLACTACT